jgi:hypothetical protein
MTVTVGGLRVSIVPKGEEICIPTTVRSSKVRSWRELWQSRDLATGENCAVGSVLGEILQ